jgi:hypothetical protein
VKGVKRWISAADNHGDHADAPTVKAFFEFVKFWKPDVKYHLGDNFDFRWLRKGASDDERRELTESDTDQGCDFLKKFKPHFWLRGNHDERLWDALGSDDGKLIGFAKTLTEEINEAVGNAVVIPYDKGEGILQVGIWALLHGYHSGMYAARQAATVYGNCLMAHVHGFDVGTAPRRIPVRGYTSPALCHLRQKYNRAQANTLRQSNGWLYGLEFPNGDRTVWHAEKIGDSFYLPSEMREVKA